MDLELTNIFFSFIQVKLLNVFAAGRSSLLDVLFHAIMIKRLIHSNSHYMIFF